MFELTKIGYRNAIDLEKRKLKAKIILGEYHSVQFCLIGSGLSHLFRLRYNTSNGPHVLVNQDSYVFDRLKAGAVLDMKCNQAESLNDGKIFKTLITSKIPHKRYTGHSIVKLSIIDN